MKNNNGTNQPSDAATASEGSGPWPGLQAGFDLHKYLLVAIVECLQEQLPVQPAAPPDADEAGSANLWMREPSAQRQFTPCIVMREHLGRGDLSVTRVAPDHLDLAGRSLTDWMRCTAPTPCSPDSDTLHLAVASTLPGVPIFVHTVGPDGDTSTHLYMEGSWSICRDAGFLPRVLRHAQLVAHVDPMSNLAVDRRAQDTAGVASAPAPCADQGDVSCDLKVLGQVYDHIAVHAAIAELRDHRHRQQRRR